MTDATNTQSKTASSEEETDLSNQTRLIEALDFVNSIPRTSRFSTMTDDEIKRERFAKELRSAR